MDGALLMWLKQLKEKELVLAHSVEKGYIVLVRRGWQLVTWHPPVGRLSKMSTLVLSAHSLLFVQFGIPAQGMTPPTVGLTISVNSV